MKNTSEAAYNRDLKMEGFVDAFMDKSCCAESAIDYQEYDKSIAEIQAMIDHSIMLGRKDEIAEWRRMLQKAKVAKRRRKARMTLTEMEYGIA